jgi:hypothetical protein
LVMRSIFVSGSYRAEADELGAEEAEEAEGEEDDAKSGDENRTSEAGRNPAAFPGGVDREKSAVGASFLQVGVSCERSPGERSTGGSAAGASAGRWEEKPFSRTTGLLPTLGAACFSPAGGCPPAGGTSTRGCASAEGLTKGSTGGTFTADADTAVEADTEGCATSACGEGAGSGGVLGPKPFSRTTE